MKKRRGWIGLWDFRQLDRDGNILWEALDQRNALADEGEYAMLDTFLRNGLAPTGFFVRLFNDTPVEGDTLADLVGEPAGNGYAAQAIARDGTVNGWPILTLNGGDYEATSKTVSFAAVGGQIGPVTHAVLATSQDNSGKLIAFAALSKSITISPEGEPLQVTIKVKLGEAAA